MNSMLFTVSLCLYGVATLAYFGFLITPAKVLGKTAHWVIIAGFLTHCATVGSRYLAAGYTPITNLHEALSFFSLAIVGLFIYFEHRYKLHILGSFVIPVALVMMIAALGFPTQIGDLNPALKSRWLAAHTIFAFGGYAAFTVSFGASIMYLIQQRFLKQKKFGPLYQKLPSLDLLDDISYRCITYGFPLLTVAIITGAIWAETAWGTYWSWDPKETWSLITWFVYAALLHGRLTTGWRGKNASIFSIIGFCILLFTFLGVNLFLPSLHSYNKPGLVDK